MISNKQLFTIPKKSIPFTQQCFTNKTYNPLFKNLAPLNNKNIAPHVFINNQKPFLVADFMHASSIYSFLLNK